MSDTESVTTEESPPYTKDEITRDEKSYYWIKKINIVGINEVVEVEFSLLYKNYDDYGIERVFGTLLIWVYNEQVGDMLVETNLVAESATRSLQWVKKDESEKPYYEFETKLGNVSKESMAEAIDAKIEEINTLVENRLKELKKKEEELKKQIPDSIFQKLEDEKKTVADGEETFTFYFEGNEDRKTYGPFLFANIWVNMKGTDSMFDGWPYSTDYVSNDVITIVQEVSRWRIRNKFNNIYPRDLALLALFIFSKENKGSVEPRILAIVEDIKKRYSIEFTNDLIVSAKVNQSEENMYLTDDGTQFMLLLLGVFFKKHGKETKEEQDRMSWSGNATLLSRTPLHQAYQLLCKTQEDHFQSRYKALYVKTVYDITISGALDGWFTALPLSAQSLATLSLENRSKQTGDQSFECNACNAKNEEIYYGGWTGNEKRNKDVGNNTALCMRRLESVIKELGISVNAEEKKRNGLWLNIVGTFQQAERKRAKLTERYQITGQIDFLDYMSRYILISIDIELSRLAGYSNVPKGGKPPETLVVGELKNWWDKVKEAYKSVVSMEAANNIAKGTGDTLTGIAKSIEDETKWEDTLNAGKKIGKKAGKAVYNTAAAVLGILPSALATAGALLTKLLVWLLHTPLLTDIINTYVAEYWKKVCKQLAIKTLEKGDKNAIDILKTEDNVLKRFSFRTGNWTKLSPEEQEKIAKENQKVVQETQENLGRITLGVLNKMAQDDNYFEEWWRINAENKDGVVYKSTNQFIGALSKLRGIGPIFQVISYVGVGGLLLAFKTQLRGVKKKWANTILRLDRMYTQSKQIANSLLLLWNQGQSCLVDGKLSLIDGKFDELYAPAYIKAFENALYMAPFYALNIIAQHQRNPKKSIDFYIEDLIATGYVSTTDENLFTVNCEIIEKTTITYGVRKNIILSIAVIMTSVAVIKTGILAKAAGGIWYVIQSAIKSSAGKMIIGADVVEYWFGSAEKPDDATKQKLDNEIIEISDLSKDDQKNIFMKCLDAIQNSTVGEFVSNFGPTKFLWAYGKYAFTKFGVQSALQLSFPDSGISQTWWDNFSNTFTNKWAEWFKTSVFLQNVLRHKDRNNLIFRTRLKELINRFRVTTPSRVRQKSEKIMYHDFHDQIVYFDAIDVSEWDQTVNPFKIIIVTNFFKAYKNRNPMQSKRYTKGWTGWTENTSEQPTKECKQVIWGKIKYGRTDTRKEQDAADRRRLTKELKALRLELADARGLSRPGETSFEKRTREDQTKMWYGPTDVKKIQEKINRKESELKLLLRANPTNQQAFKVESTISSKQKKEESPLIFESTFEDDGEDLDDEGWIQEKELEEKISKKKRKLFLLNKFESTPIFELKKLEKEIKTLEDKLKKIKEGADDDDEVQILGEVKILSGRKKGDGNSFETKKKGDDEDFVDLRPKKTPKPALIRSLKF